MYSLGVIMFQATYGMFPYGDGVATGKVKGKSYEEIARLLLKEELEFERNKNIPDGLEELLEGLLQKEPEWRLTLDGVLEHPWLLEATGRTRIGRYRGSYVRREVTEEDLMEAIALPGMQPVNRRSRANSKPMNGFGPPPGSPLALAIPGLQPATAPGTREREPSLNIGGLPMIMPDGSGCGWRIEGMGQPAKCANWAIPRRLMYGGHPCVGRPEEHQKNVEGIVSCGVTHFVSLLGPAEAKEFPSYQKLAQSALHLYLKKLKTMSGRNMVLHPIKCLNYAMPQWREPKVDHRGERVKGGVEEDDLINILGQIISLLENRQNVVYVHCDAKGLGRSTVVIACLLCHLYGLSAIDALTRLQLYQQERADIRDLMMLTPMFHWMSWQVFRCQLEWKLAPINPPLFVQGTVEVEGPGMKYVNGVLVPTDMETGYNSDEDSLQAAILDDLIQDEEAYKEELEDAKRQAAMAAMMSMNMDKFMNHLNGEDDVHARTPMNKGVQLDLRGQQLLGPPPDQATAGQFDVPHAKPYDRFADNSDTGAAGDHFKY